jgi:hypothetical protein
MSKKYTFEMVVVKPTGKGGKPLNPKPIKPTKPIKPVQKSGGGMNDNKPKDPKPKVIPLLPEGVFYKGKAKDYPGVKELIRRKNKKAYGGELKGDQKKLDKNKDGKISGEDFAMMKKSTGGEMKPRKVEKAFLGKMIKGAGKSIGRLFGAKKSATTTPGTVTMSKSGIGGEGGMLPQLLQKAIDDGNIKPASKGRMMKASKGGGMMQRPMGGEIKKGYGAARQKGQGLQDENLIPGKSMDYYKDLI